MSMFSSLRGPSSFEKYEAAARSAKSTSNPANLELPPIHIEISTNHKSGNANGNAIEIGIGIGSGIGTGGFEWRDNKESVSIRSMWLKVLDSKSVEDAIENIINLYENGFISEWEYKLRRSEAEKLLPPSSIIGSGLDSPSTIVDPVSLGDCFVVHGGVKGGKDTGSSQEKAHTSDGRYSMRVFLSSTFRDMQQERDQLVKHTFPTLRAMCMARGVVFKEIDLRWGITEEQATKGEIINICLGEIDNCRPYFINFIGSRYGWVPTEFPKAAVAKYPWLASIAPGEKSITELEIMHGALNNVTGAKQALFYSRNNKYGDFADSGESENEIKKINELKLRIRSSGLSYKEYTSAEGLAKSVLEDLTKIINSDFPESASDSKESEDTLHQLYAAQKTQIYIGRRQHFQSLDYYMSNSSCSPYLVTGSVGVGKSSLLANWVTLHDQRDQIISHYVGSGGESADCTSMLRRIIYKIKDRFHWDEDVPEDPKKIMHAFARWIRLGSQGEPLFIVIDGINQLEDSNSAHLLAWLPEVLPHNVKLIISSTLGHNTTKVLLERKSPNLVLTGLAIIEKEMLTAEYLGAYGKTLSLTNLDNICNEESTRNPLYLSCLLEEIRIFGVFEELDQLISYYLRARHINLLLEKIITRLEKDYSQDYPGVVKDLLCLLLVSHNGLTEDELLELLGVPTFTLAPILSAAKHLFVTRFGMLNLFHSSLHNAIERRYMHDDSLKLKYHSQLAYYFEEKSAKSLNPNRMSRKAQELPYHLLQSKQYYRLQRCLSDIDVFQQIFFCQSKFHLKRLWLTFGDQYDAAACYEESLCQYELLTSPTPSQLLSIILPIAKFVREMLQYKGCARLLERALVVSKEIDARSLLTAKILYRIAQLYWGQGKWDIAEKYCLESLSIRETILGTDHLAVAKCLCGMGEIYVTRDQKKASVWLQRSLDIRRKLLGNNHHLVSRILHDLAIVEDFKGNHNEAIRLHQEAIRIRETTLGPNNHQLAASWENLGTTFKLAHKFTEAETAFLKALKINIDVHGEMHPGTAACYEWLSMIKRDLGDEGMKDEYHMKALRIGEELRKNDVATLGERVAD